MYSCYCIHIKLSVNRPKYSRAADTRKEWNVKLKEKAIESEKNVKKEWRAKGLSTYANTVRYGHRDRAQTQNRDNLHAIHFRAEETPSDWLNKCYIGRVSDLSKVSSLNESFILGGLGYIKVKFLGGFHVLLKGENELKIKEGIEENKAWFEEMFDTIIPWEEQFVAVDKLVWVRCRGLPLKLWNTDCFKHIAALLGTLIEVDEATMALEELEYARFKIRVSVGCEAKITSYMKINEVLYQVSVEEECTVPDYKLCPSSAPIFSTIIGKDDLESRTPTAPSRADVDKRFGPPEMAQEGETHASYVVKEGGCIGKNLNEAKRLSDPVVHGEEQLWIGPLGSLTISENSQDLNESEQGGQLGEDKASPHHEIFTNEVITAIPSRSSGDTGERECSGWANQAKVASGKNLVDIPYIGRKYTWYRPNGKAKSRLDRYLVSFEWLQHWSGSKQYITERQISDHCALVLKSNVADWGPKPFRFLDIWQENKEFEDFV
ncbi:hypothetical protein PHAVU_002G142300, partial [Phaseolus vulgaris]